MKKNWIAAVFLFLILFALPFEHKYDKLFRFYSLTLIPNGIDDIHFFEKKIYFYPSDLFTLLLFGIGLWQVRGKMFSKGAIFLAIVFVASIASIVASEFSSYPVAYTRLWQLFTPMALFMFLANGWLEKEKVTKIFVWSLFSSAIMQAVIAISQYLLQHSLGLRILSEAPLYTVIPSVPSGRTCLLDFFHSAGPEVILRAMGTMSHPNVLGGFLAVTLLITSYLFLHHPKIRLWLGAGYWLQLFALATTFSRSAIYAWCLGTLFYLSWTRLRMKTETKTLSTCVVFSLLCVGTVFHEQYISRGGIVTYNECTRASDSLRLSYQSVALQMTKEHPWLGVGFGQFSCRSVPFFKDTPELAASGVHNIYLRLCAETGLISLAAFISWIFLLLWAGWKAPPTLETGFLMALFLMILFIGCCDQYPLVFQQGALMLFAVAGLLARYGCFTRNRSLQTIAAHDR